MRITILAVPPVIPLIHDDLALSETQVGLLVGLPLFVFAVASVPGSLLVARLGAWVTMTIGLAMTALAGATRGGATDVWMLYGATVLMGFGVAVMQPATPALVREWLPQRVALGMATSTNGVLAAVTLAPALTIPVVLPLVGGRWRLDLVVWSVPVLATAVLFVLLGPRGIATSRHDAAAPRWWPDWKSPLIWLLGLTFGCNNSAYFGTNAFLPDYLTRHGSADLVGTTLTLLNGAQLSASVLMLFLAERIERRAWPYLVFGPLTLAGSVGIVATSGIWLVVSAMLVGFATGIVFIVVVALPPLLSQGGDAHRTAAGMFTISYTCGVIVPTVSGALWDLTGIPEMAFAPLGLCAIGMTAFGLALSRYGGEPTVGAPSNQR